MWSPAYTFLLGDRHRWMLFQALNEWWNPAVRIKTINCSNESASSHFLRLTILIFYFNVGNKGLPVDADGSVSTVSWLCDTDSMAGARSYGQGYWRTSIRGNISIKLNM